MIGAYVGCTVLVLLWLGFIIHVTLAENEEVAAGSTDPGHTTQLIRVSEDPLLRSAMLHMLEFRVWIPYSKP